MRILIVGGTSFVGRAIAQSAWRQGHAVTVINRGVTDHDLPDEVERLVGDRTSDLSALTGRSFDATVDTTAYRPSDVERLAAALGPRGGHHLQISSISAYRDPASPGATEATAELHDEAGLDPEGPITGETYGPLKAAAERAAAAHFGESITVVRPTYVIGGHDATLRFPYWVQRARRGGVVAAPGPRASAMQYVDARDLANFVVGLTASATPGAFHVAGPNPAAGYVDVIERVVRHVAPDGTTVRVVSPERVREAGLEAKMPLWSGGGSETLMDVDAAKALAHGLFLRPLEDSVDEVVEWWGDRPWPERWLSESEERRLLG
ncbi:MAG: NAD-dependent epimerase/dehydratase family protein [Acidimicrobiales bacterium]